VIDNEDRAHEMGHVARHVYPAVTVWFKCTERILPRKMKIEEVFREKFSGFDLDGWL
jgi:hypothetical protein